MEDEEVNQITQFIIDFIIDADNVDEPISTLREALIEECGVTNTKLYLEYVTSR